MVVVLATPCFQVEVARQVNCAASGAPLQHLTRVQQSLDVDAVLRGLVVSVTVMSLAPSPRMQFPIGIV